MKMRITVEGKKYDVEVEMLDAALPTAAAPAAPVLKPTPAAKLESKPDGKPAAVIETKAEAKGEHKADPKPDPKVDAKGWHQVSEGKPGEVCAPVSGTVGEVRVKIGDAIKVGDSLVVLEVSKLVSTGEQAFAGSIRSLLAGTVRDVLIKKGEAVKPGQVLARIG
ncbi:MAG: biotin/lipoyl-binding protein [Phycisphaerales bacterium]|nr:biotin/lipoyl-binding protein [Phycisphaerales bacterium]